MNIYFDHERPRQCPGFATSSAIVRLSPKMRKDVIVNLQPSLRVSEIVFSLPSAEAIRTPSLAFERLHPTRTSLLRTHAGQFASGLIPSHDTKVCLVYLQARP